MEFGSRALKVSEGGLPWQHWLIAIALGFVSWIVAFFVKFIPDRMCPSFGKKKAKLEDIAINNYNKIKGPTDR
jgi:hypothetical protein